MDGLFFKGGIAVGEDGGFVDVAVGADDAVDVHAREMELSDLDQLDRTQVLRCEPGAPSAAGGVRLLGWDQARVAMFIAGKWTTSWASQ